MSSVTQLAIAHFGCRSCGADRTEPCVPFRTVGPGDYGRWYAHAARRKVLDDLYMQALRAGLRTGEARARWKIRKAATEATKHHEAREGSGGLSECVCGWPNKEDFDAHKDDPERWFPDYEVHLFEQAGILP